jgi:RNA polymerase sigma-70 factor (ECF subfamily)
MADPDTELMLKFQQGDDSAFKTLITRNQRIVLNLAYKYLGNRADAEDVCQDVFLKVCRAAETYQPTAKFTTWVYRITVNACLNRIRSVQTHRNVSMDADLTGDGGGVELADGVDPPASQHLEQEELETKVREAMGRLPDSQRTAVLLRRFQELSYEEIARVMDTTIPAVKSLLARARQTLKTSLSRYF